LHLYALHYGSHWPFGVLVWYLSDKKWRYGFKQNEEVPVWPTIAYRPALINNLRPLILLTICNSQCIFTWQFLLSINGSMASWGF